MPQPPHYQNIFPEWRDAAPYVMDDMVSLQPALAEDILGQHEEAGAVAGAIEAALAADEPIVVVGCGTSEHGSQAVADLLDEAIRARGGPAGRVDARQAFDAALAPRRGGVLIAASHGGHSRATASAIEAARGAGATTVLITAFAASPARGIADQVFATPLIDASYCHTVGYTSPILAAALVSAKLAGYELDASAVRAHMERVLEVRPAATRAADQFRSAERVLTGGSGVDRAPARELALKIAEGAWIPSAMLDLENVLHGHLVAHDAQSTLVLITTDTRKRATRAVRTGQILRAAGHIGLRAVAILDEDAVETVGADAADAIIAVPVGAGLPGSLGSILASALALQLLTMEVVRVRGTNPDLLRREEPRYFEAVAIGEAKHPRMQ
jgi:glucosamine--fructose-6-phosphate aminotransferase (isomerizing)